MNQYRVTLTYLVIAANECEAIKEVAKLNQGQPTCNATSISVCCNPLKWPVAERRMVRRRVKLNWQAASRKYCLSPGPSRRYEPEQQRRAADRGYEYGEKGYAP